MKSILCPIGVLLGAIVGNFFIPVVLATDDMDEDYVTCGSAIKLTNMENGGTHYLSSAQHKINSGSNQQLVTSSPTRTDSSSLWIIASGHGIEPCVPGAKIAFGSKIRFTHMNTGSNLHSHGYKSPLTNNQEVTGFGDDGSGDAGDNWKVSPHRSKGNYWKRDEVVFINHLDTGAKLGSSMKAQFTRNNCGNRCPVMDHLEVYSAKVNHGASMMWKAEHGVYLSL
mmetsp:Transcript_11261/g.13320  ORF Transcript_11261/g.13320 Transcript_11261/m.13320 type:complete len:225 (-) Transcript_11261:180-854(-)